MYCEKIHYINCFTWYFELDPDDAHVFFENIIVVSSYQVLYLHSRILLWNRYSLANWRHHCGIPLCSLSRYISSRHTLSDDLHNYDDTASYRKAISYLWKYFMFTRTGLKQGKSGKAKHDHLLALGDIDTALKVWIYYLII